MRLAFTLTLSLGLALASVATAHAQQCHKAITARVTGGAPRAWWVSVATSWTAGAGHVRDADSGYRRTTRGYRGGALELAAGWRRLTGRLGLGGYHVEGRGTGLDDARAALALTITPARARVRAGLSATLAVPTGDPDAGRGMGHTMAGAGAWATAATGRVAVAVTATYARALGDGAEHAAHLHGGDLWPLVDPMNAVEVAVDVTGTVALVPDRLAVTAGVLAAVPVDRGARRVVPALGLVHTRGAISLAATVRRPVVGDPFVARGDLALEYRF